MVAAEANASRLMPIYEYKVVPAPRRGEKAKGAKTTADRFALALTQLMNTLARDGWEYLRADTLPCEERVGLTGKATAFQNMLVFRREAVVAEQTAPKSLAAPTATAPLLTTEAPEGTAPKVIASTPAPAAAPTLGPARSGEVAAE
jgi:hypothetical protein